MFSHWSWLGHLNLCNFYTCCNMLHTCTALRNMLTCLRLYRATYFSCFMPMVSLVLTFLHYNCCSMLGSDLSSPSLVLKKKSHLILEEHILSLYYLIWLQLISLVVITFHILSMGNYMILNQKEQHLFCLTQQIRWRSPFYFS